MLQPLGVKWKIILFYLTLLSSSPGLIETKTDEDPSNFGQRSRDHIAETLKLDRNKETVGQQRLTSEILAKLATVYKEAVKPLEDAYKFRMLSQRAVNEKEINAPPRLLLIGPWSTGKSSLINYILDIEDENTALISGPQPTTSDFTVLMHGKEQKHVEGLTLVTEDDSYESLEKFGQNFLQRFEGIKLPKKLLEKITIIDTPGILENRKQQERGYPFNDVCQWFIDRSDLIFVVFDLTKLDAGQQLELLFEQLRGYESRVRILLNKADTVEIHELMRVYGALFWTLAPLVNVTEPPRVYIGSFWSKKIKNAVYPQLFLHEEISLFKDMHDVIANHVENKISLVRQYAIRVRNHALIIDKYLDAFQNNKPILSFIRDTETIKETIVNKPFDYNIYEAVLGALEQVSVHDLPPFSVYQKFFEIHNLESFKPLNSYCGYFQSCYLDSLNEAINVRLPSLLREFNNKLTTAQTRVDL